MSTCNKTRIIRVIKGKILKYGLLLFSIIYLTGCIEISLPEFLKEPETGRVSFRLGEVDKASMLNLGKIKAATIALLPVRSSMGGGLGEEVVTKYFYENLADRYKNIKFISNEEVSDFFTDLDMWDDYFEYLTRYHQSAVADTNFDELKGLYQKLKADYIININSDYIPIPRYPTMFEVNIQAQIWDIDSAKMIWEGLVQGRDMVISEEEEVRIKEKMVDWACKHIAGEMGRERDSKEPALNRPE